MPERLLEAAALGQEPHGHPEFHDMLEWMYDLEDGSGPSQSHSEQQSSDAYYHSLSVLDLIYMTFVTVFSGILYFLVLWVFSDVWRRQKQLPNVHRTLCGVSLTCPWSLKNLLEDTASVIGMTFLAQGVLNLTLYIINFDFYFSHVIDFGKNYHIVDGVINFVIALKCSIIISLGTNQVFLLSQYNGRHKIGLQSFIMAVVSIVPPTMVAIFHHKVHHLMTNLTLLPMLASILLIIAIYRMCTTRKTPLNDDELTSSKLVLMILSINAADMGGVIVIEMVSWLYSNHRFTVMAHVILDHLSQLQLPIAYLIVYLRPDMAKHIFPCLSKNAISASQGDGQLHRIAEGENGDTRDAHEPVASYQRGLRNEPLDRVSLTSTPAQMINFGGRFKTSVTEDLEPFALDDEEAAVDN